MLDGELRLVDAKARWKVENEDEWLWWVEIRRWKGKVECGGLDLVVLSGNWRVTSAAWNVYRGSRLWVETG